MYIHKQESAQKIAERYDVSVVTVLSWIKFYEIKPRTHYESMNTSKIKRMLRERKLHKPKKFFKKLSPEKAYILGVLCGDASISNESIRFEIRKDEEFISNFVQCFERVYGLKFQYKYYKKRNSFIVYISNQIICADLFKYGKFKTFEWSVPLQIAKTKDNQVIYNFLRGIFDSEGTSSRYCVSMSSANRKGIIQVGELLDRLGIKNRIMQTKRGYYILYITKKERLKKFREKIGFIIKRKIEPLNGLK